MIPFMHVRLRGSALAAAAAAMVPGAAGCAKLEDMWSRASSPPSVRESGAAGGQASVPGPRVDALGGYLSIVPPKGWLGEGRPPEVSGFAGRLLDGATGTLEITRLSRPPRGGYSMYGTSIDLGGPSTLVAAVKAFVKSLGAKIGDSGYLGRIQVGGHRGERVQLTFESPAGPVTLLHVFVDTLGGLVVFKYTAPAADFAAGLEAVEKSLGSVQFSESARRP
jgi:hypothetical protein